jgi:hypothetical protein
VGFAAFDRHDPTQAANMRRSDKTVGPGSAHDVDNLVNQRVVAAGDNQCLFDFLHRT